MNYSPVQKQKGKKQRIIDVIFSSDILRFDHLHGMSVVSSKVSGMILDVALNADNFSL